MWIGLGDQPALVVGKRMSAAEGFMRSCKVCSDVDDMYSDAWQVVSRSNLTSPPNRSVGTEG